MQRLGILLIVLGIVYPVNAADKKAGVAMSVAGAACHGGNGSSVNAKYPNLAGQKAAYLTKQLKAFRAGTRKNTLMKVMADLLSDTDTENLAAFFSSLQGTTGDVTSQIPAEISRTRVSFPANYKQDFTHYTTINFPKRKQVRTYLANDVVLQAARNGDPLPDGSMLFVEIFKAKLDAEKNPIKGNDGYFVKDKLVVYTAMAKQKGWGDDFPELLRNGDWNYAVFKSDKTIRKGLNQASCLVCHLPHVDTSYVFSLKQLTEKARAAR